MALYPLQLQLEPAYRYTHLELRSAYTHTDRHWLALAMVLQASMTMGEPLDGCLCPDLETRRPWSDSVLSVYNQKRTLQHFETVWLDN